MYYTPYLFPLEYNNSDNGTNCGTYGLYVRSIEAPRFRSR